VDIVQALEKGILKEDTVGKAVEAMMADEVGRSSSSKK